LENHLKVFKSDKFDVADTASLSLFIYPRLLLVFAKNDLQKTTAVHVYEDFDQKRSEEYFDSDVLLRLNVPLQIFFHEPIFTLVPDTLFQPEKEKEYLQVLNEQEYLWQSFSTPVDSGQLHLISSIPENSGKFFTDRFSQVRFHHGSASFLSYLIQEKVNQIGEEIILYHMGSHLYVAGFSERELVLFNKFEIASKDEMLKYILIVIKTLNFDENHARITLYGTSGETGITEEWLGRYFSNFRLTMPYSNQSYITGFNQEYPKHLLEFFWQHS
jgi:hypothetical protein